ncbi:MAG: hypothetical protein VZQ83_08640 [Eubacterium sp.]|nr:hypothetical protein [Eubacterium sp.]
MIKFKNTKKRGRWMVSAKKGGRLVKLRSKKPGKWKFKYNHCPCAKKNKMKKMDKPRKMKKMSKMAKMRKMNKMTKLPRLKVKHK